MAPHRLCERFNLMALLAAVAFVLLASAACNSPDSARRNEPPAAGGNEDAVGTSALPSEPDATASLSPSGTEASPSLPPRQAIKMAPLLIDSLGPIRVGMTPRQASSALGAPVVVNREDFNPSCRYAHIKGLPELPLFMVLNGHIARIDVYPRYVKRGKSFRPVLRSGIKTPEGAGLGSREQEVIDLYPGRVKITPHPYARPGHYLTVRPDDPSERRYRYVFETDGEKVTAFRSGKTQAVAFIEGCA